MEAIGDAQLYRAQLAGLYLPSRDASETAERISKLATLLRANDERSVVDVTRTARNAVVTGTIPLVVPGPALRISPPNLH